MNETRHIGNYQIISELGAGSFGRVYLAQHAVLTNRKVAIKLMNVAYLASDEEQEHFLQEARFLEVLKHPSILPVLDVGIYERLPYLVAEYAPGGSLRQRLKQQRIFSERAALTMLVQVGKALQHAHQQNIIHRDIKPENILFNAEGHALLADFGLATTLSSASVKYVSNAGTPSYMSPEQFKGAVSRESDQYAFACIAYELLTGHPVFTAPDPVAMMYMHVNEEPTPPSQHNSMLSPHIEQALLKALSKKRQDRFSDVQAFLDALTVGISPDIQSMPFSESFIATAPIIQPADSHSELSPLEETALKQPQRVPNPITPVLPLLEEPLNGDSENTFVIPREEAEEKTDLIEDKTVLLAQSQPDQPAQPAETNTPQPLVSAKITNKLPIQVVPLDPPPTVATRILQTNKRTWLRVGIIVSLLVLLISSGIVYAVVAKAPKTVGSSTPTSTIGSVPTNQPTSTQGSGTQTSKAGKQNHATSTAAATANANNQPTSAPTANPVATSANVVITPASKGIKNSYTITAIPGSANAAQHQIAAHMLTSQQTQQKSASATGQGSTPATHATGLISLQNSSSSSMSFSAGMQFSNGAGSVSLNAILDQSATVAAGTTVAVPSHIDVAGSVGNVPADTFYGGSASSQFWMENYSPFSGGQDAQTYPILQQSDIDNAANSLVGSLTTTAKNGVQSQMQANQQLIQQAQCSSNVASHDQAGSHVASTTVTVAVTCKGEAYAPQDAQSVAASWLQQDVSATYQLTGQTTTTILQTQLSNAQQGIITITVQAESTGIYQFGSAQKQQIAQAIAGQSQQNAQAILARQAGVAQAAITINGGDGQTLPPSPQQITITIG